RRFPKQNENSAKSTFGMGLCVRSITKLKSSCKENQTYFQCEIYIEKFETTAEKGDLFAYGNAAFPKIFPEKNISAAELPQIAMDMAQMLCCACRTAWKFTAFLPIDAKRSFCNESEFFGRRCAQKFDQNQRF